MREPAAEGPHVCPYRPSNPLASHEMMTLSTSNYAVPRGDITAYGFAYVRV